MRDLILAMAVILLTGCGGGDYEELDDIEPASRAAMSTPAINVLEWGDSTAAGSLLSNGSNPGHEAQKVLVRLGYNFDVRNEAVGGMPALNLLRGRHPLHLGMPFREFPSLAWTNIGMIRSGINERRIGQTQEEFKATLQTIADEHRAAGKILILTTPSPLDPAIVKPARVAYVEASAETIRSVFRANRDIAVLCDQYRYAKEADIVSWKLDGVHPNEAATIFEGRRQAKCILRAAALLATR